MSLQEKVKIESKAYWDDLRWASEHSNELYKKYENMWIAIVDKKVVAYGTDLSKVEKNASEKAGKSPDEIPVKYIDGIGAIYG